MEQWKTIKNYEDYMASNMGNIKSLKFGKERILKPSLNPAGYYMVVLCKNGKNEKILVHRLVYEAFKEDLIPGLVVDHIDSNTKNNNLDNLQQITYRANIARSKVCKNKTSKYVGVDWNNQRNRWKAMIRINGKQKFLGFYKCELEASAAYQAELSKINF